MEKVVEIMIVDDHEIFRKGLVMVINKLKDVKVIAEARNGEEFLNMLDKIKPELVLMDIQMPVMNGIDATKAALQKYPNLKIVALSMFGEEEYLQNMVDAGVKGFLLKNISKEDLYRAIQLISEGKNYYSEELLLFFTRKYIQPPKQQESADVNLTKRELEVLQLIAEGYTDAEIAEKLFISQRTVNGHRANLITKTGSRNTVNLLTYAIKNKLVDM
ncbi:MAG: response regulator transcription factor [Bacteroidales bacterium]